MYDSLMKPIIGLTITKNDLSVVGLVYDSGVELGHVCYYTICMKKLILQHRSYIEKK